MTPRVVFVRVHEPDAVRTIITEALAIVNEHDGLGDLRVPMFDRAVELLAARTVIDQQVQALPFDINALRGH